MREGSDGSMLEGAGEGGVEMWRGSRSLGLVDGLQWWCLKREGERRRWVEG